MSGRSVTERTAELELEPLEPGHGLRAARHVIGIAEPDRPGGRRPGALEPEEPPHGLAGDLPAQVVECRVERRLGGHLAWPGGKPSADLLERERVVSE
jgi:hypothetical protein